MEGGREGRGKGPPGQVAPAAHNLCVKFLSKIAKHTTVYVYRVVGL